MKPCADKTAVIAGAGPAGLTAALQLLRQSDIHPVIAEASAEIGGISRTVKHNGNRIDIGGHRFFSKSKRVTDWWAALMPMQTAPALDEILIGSPMTSRMTDNRDKETGGLSDDGAATDPGRSDRVMLSRRRVSRIYYLRRFFDYPISLSIDTLRNMGLWRTLAAGSSYLKSAVHKRPEKSLEDFYINRFGRRLYSMFFEDYTEKVWGLHPSQLGADWGSQRVKGLSITAILRDMLAKKLGSKDASTTETSLIEEFIYPKYGPGQLWETAASEITAAGGEILMQSPVKEINVKGGKVVSVVIGDEQTGTEKTVACDYFLSSMPIKELIASLRGIEIPAEVAEAAATLPYRDFITAGILVDRLKIKNETRLKTYLDRVPDTWIYIQERDVKLGRIQIFNNWSPYMVKDFKDKIWLGLEYFCFENDALWSMTDTAFINMAVSELVKIGIIDSTTDVEDSVCIRVKKAYPAYHGSYYSLDKIKAFLDGISNLYCIGRNGQHRYNNMDHSMLTAMAAVDDIVTPDPVGRAAVWEVNTETDYHEGK